MVGPWRCNTFPLQLAPVAGSSQDEETCQAGERDDRGRRTPERLVGSQQPCTREETGQNHEKGENLPSQRQADCPFLHGIAVQLLPLGHRDDPVGRTLLNLLVLLNHPRCGQGPRVLLIHESLGHPRLVAGLLW